ncbi:MAG: GNAT family N-acetyltransferase [Actinomycetales bacterium]|nr:GNAT family N-acetyltransferase [Actinomycetales bacterium]
MTRGQESPSGDPSGAVRIVERLPTVDESLALRRAVGWTVHDPDATAEGLARTLFAVCAELDGKIIGMAKVAGNGSTCFYVHDVVVAPGHQGRGIGRRLMERVMAYLATNACAGAVVALMAAEGREGFYEPFGFVRRPTASLGHGMTQFWQG